MRPIIFAPANLYKGLPIFVEYLFFKLIALIPAILTIAALVAQDGFFSNCGSKFISKNITILCQLSS